MQAPFLTARSGAFLFFMPYFILRGVEINSNFTLYPPSESALILQCNRNDNDYRINIINNIKPFTQYRSSVVRL